MHVKLDTGMGRLGTRDPEEAARVARAAAEAPGLRLAGAMTHFATSDDDPAFVREQLAAFTPWAERLRAEHGDLLVHAANSAAALAEPAARFDLVRCGIAVYGLDPFHRDPADHGLEPALELRTYVAEVKRIAPGQSAGYGRRFVAREPGWLGTLPIGYGDGVRRGLTNNADVLVQGRRVPLVGTVSMDNITVDLGPGEREPVPRGAPAVVIGPQAGEAILAEEVGGAPRDHQLRGGVRDLGARAARAPPRRDARVSAADPLAAARAALEGQDAWLVGGAVRDRLLGRVTTDFDVALPGDPRAAARRLARATGAASFSLSDAFGAWRVVAPGGAWQVDLVPLRDGDLAADLAARDFTINAIAEPLAGGERVDPHDGAADLAARRLRMVAPGALADDPLRTLRAVRLAVELELEIEPATGAAVTAHAPALAQVSPERVFAELKRIVVAPAVLRGMELLAAHGLTDVVLPELTALRGVEQNVYHHADVYDHTLEVLDAVAALEHDPAAAGLGEHAARDRGPARRAAGRRAHARRRHALRRPPPRRRQARDPRRAARRPGHVHRARPGGRGARARRPAAPAGLRAARRLRRRAHPAPPAPRLPRP